MSPSAAREVKPKSTIRERLLGCKTLSSLAFPSSELGSSCSLSILNLADRFGMIKLVLKSSADGRASAMLNSGFCSGWRLFLFHFEALFLIPGDSCEGVRERLRSEKLVFMPASGFFRLRIPILGTVSVSELNVVHSVRGTDCIQKTVGRTAQERLTPVCCVPPLQSGVWISESAAEIVSKMDSIVRTLV